MDTNDKIKDEGSEIDKVIENYKKNSKLAKKQFSYKDLIDKRYELAKKYSNEKANIQIVSPDSIGIKYEGFNGNATTQIVMDGPGTLENKPISTYGYIPIGDNYINAGMPSNNLQNLNNGFECVPINPKKSLKKAVPLVINKDEELIINIEELADELAEEVLENKTNTLQYHELLNKYKKLILKHERKRKE